MKNRFAVVCLALVVTMTSACSTLGRFSPAYHSFDHGLALFNQGRFDEAVPYLEDATREDPEFAQAYFYLGRAYISQSRWRAAIQPLRTAFRLSPRESQQEIMNLLIDAMFAAALNDFDLGRERRPLVRFNSTL
ncbi:MAG TPA: tetratricopeptide repeat protein [Candidatus Binatia bacterium]|jgi:tetratricopeptide (TPR) repeat protein